MEMSLFSWKCECSESEQRRLSGGLQACDGAASDIFWGGWGNMYFYCMYLYTARFLFLADNSATPRPGICNTAFLLIDAALQWIDLYGEIPEMMPSKTGEK